MRKGLTIGELLVTMAIIGVIAALVIPGFLKDYHKKLYTTKLHKSYEMLFSAIETACNDLNVSSFNQTPYASNDATKQKEFLDKYFKTVEPAKQNGAGNKTYFTARYRKLTDTSTYKNMSLPGNSATAKLKSGEIIDILCDESTGDANECIVAIDINGTDEPNIGGRDMFRFRIDKQNNQVMSHSNSNECTDPSDIYGHGCLNRLIKDGWVMEY